MVIVLAFVPLIFAFLGGVWSLELLDIPRLGSARVRSVASLVIRTRGFYFPSLVIHQSPEVFWFHPVDRGKDISSFFFPEQLIMFVAENLVPMFSIVVMSLVGDVELKVYGV